MDDGTELSEISSECTPTSSVPILIEGDRDSAENETTVDDLQNFIMPQPDRGTSLFTFDDVDTELIGPSEYSSELIGSNRLTDESNEPQILQGLEYEARLAKESVLCLQRQVGDAAKRLKDKQIKNAEIEQALQRTILNDDQNNKLCQQMDSKLKKLSVSIEKADNSISSLTTKIEAMEKCNKNHTQRKREKMSLQNFLMTGLINNITDLIDNMRPIGHGGEGRVYRGKLKADGQSVVVKSYFLDCEQSSRIEYAMLILANNVRGVKKPIGLLHTQTSYYLIVEDDHNSMPLDVVIEKSSLTESQIQCIFSQMAHILYDLKSKYIKHRDVKLDNFLLDTKNGRLSIIDFGWAMYSAIDYITIDEVKRSGETLMGTCDYLPPETDSPSGTLVSYEKATVFALACVLFELFFGYQGKVRQLMLKDGMTTLVNNLSKSKKVSISKGAISLLDKCSKSNPNERLSLEGVLLHPWVPSDKLDTISFKTPSIPSRKIKSFEL